MLSHGARAGWSQTGSAFRREIRLIVAATKLPNSPNQHATVWFSNVWWCVDRYCSFKNDLGKKMPLAPGELCKIQWAKSASFKNSSYRFGLCVRLSLLRGSFSTTSSQGRVDTEDLVSKLKLSLARPSMSPFETLLTIKITHSSMSTKKKKKTHWEIFQLKNLSENHDVAI